MALRGSSVRDMQGPAAHGTGGSRWEHKLASAVDALTVWRFPMAEPDVARVARSLTLTEIGVIFSLAVSALTGAFTFGVLYGQVNSNTDRINKVELVTAETTRKLERIDANVSFLAELAREQRTAR